MNHFVVSARKYRPQSFRDVVGQQSITNTLENAIENNHLAQALLFTGPRGVGKTTCARILAKRINEEATSQTDENDFSFNIFELDAASNNSVDDIRSLIDQVRIPPQVGKYKVYIIDEVHMLSTAAFNAFLKTLEEPPKHAIFILATTEKHKIIPTILSRCQIFDFKRITVGDAREYLKYISEEQGIQAESEALQIIAQKADGAMRDALSIFDRVVSFCGDTITRQAVSEILNVLDYDTYFTITDLILDNQLPKLLLSFNDIISRGFDGHHFITGLAGHFRDLMVAKNPATIALMEVGVESQEKYKEQSQRASVPFLMEAIDIAQECDLQYKISRNPRLLVELALMRLASLTYEGDKKKNDGRFIISVSELKKLGVIEGLPSSKSEVKSVQSSTSKGKNQEVSSNTNEENSVSTVSEPNTRNYTQKEDLEGVSALSLKSVAYKLEAQKLKDSQVKVDVNNLPKDQFTQQQLSDAWETYIEKILVDGQKIQASNLRTAKPFLADDFLIRLEVPSQTMKTEILQEQHELLSFLHQEFNNYGIRLEITISENMPEAKGYFTPEQKLEKMIELNPLIAKLVKDLDLQL